MNKLQKRELRRTQEQVRQDQARANEKALRKAEKAARRQEQELVEADDIDRTGPVDVACLIHSNGYEWAYVEKLYNMVSRNLSRPIRFHVYTEESRSVPAPMIKHALTEWPGLAGPKKSWWYKLQLFNTDHHSGPLLYFDLDTVIVNNIDWIPNLHTKFFWAPKDYRHLWRPNHVGVNSSVMWWDTRRFDFVWKDFKVKDLNHVTRQHQGDQDYISEVISTNETRYFLPMNVMSWRWQVKDGGMNFRTRVYLAPNTGTSIDYRTSVLVFHGHPKPHEVADPVIHNFWC